LVASSSSSTRVANAAAFASTRYEGHQQVQVELPECHVRWIVQDRCHL